LHAIYHETFNQLFPATTVTNTNVQNLVSQHKTNFDLPLNYFASWLKLYQWIRMYMTILFTTMQNWQKIGFTLSVELKV